MKINTKNNRMEQEIRIVEGGEKNRKKGLNGERYYAKFFRSFGFVECQTSRKVARPLDDAKVDLVGLPFNIQIKTGIHKNMSVGKELSHMDACIKSMFDENHPDYNKPRLLIHKYDIGRGKRRKPENEQLYMSFEQFNRFKEQVPDLVWDDIKQSKYDTKSEFKTIVRMTFDYFVEKILPLYIDNEK